MQLIGLVLHVCWGEAKRKEQVGHDGPESRRAPERYTPFFQKLKAQYKSKWEMVCLL